MSDELGQMVRSALLGLRRACITAKWGKLGIFVRKEDMHVAFENAQQFKSAQDRYFKELDSSKIDIDFLVALVLDPRSVRHVARMIADMLEPVVEWESLRKGNEWLYAPHCSWDAGSLIVTIDNLARRQIGDKVPVMPNETSAYAARNYCLELLRSDPPPIAIRVDALRGIVMIGRETFTRVKPHLCRMLEALVIARDKGKIYVTGSQMNKLPGCRGKKICRELQNLKKLVPPLKPIISGDNKGYRLAG